MNTAGERQVPIGRAPYIEFIGRVELLRVAIGGADA